MITNLTKNSFLCQNEKHCKNIFSKGIGLMFSKKKTLVMFFNKEVRIGLHNCFVFFPLNLYFLDKDMKVIEIRKRFNPFTFYTSKKKAQYLIETPFKLDVEINDYLSITNNK